MNVLRIAFVLALITLLKYGEAKMLDADPVVKGKRRDIAKSVQKATLNKAKLVEKCYGDLGCFKTGEPFYHPRWRSDSLPPADPEKMNIKFMLYTRTRWKTPEYLHLNDTESLKRAGYDGGKSTKFIIHGFTDSGYEPWVKGIATEYLKLEDCNVVGMDWGEGAVIPYTQAASNTRVVGAVIAKMIKIMVLQYNANLDQLHLVGHSLGAHIAGYAGERLNKIARISGLDPAGPYFQFMPEITRLDTSDAVFVDVIHTDVPKPMVASYGLLQSIGHVDFFPNGGQYQPGCERTAIVKLVDDGLDNGIRETAACNHGRSIDYFTESIASHCPFIGHECGSWEDFVEGRCISCGKDNLACAIIGHRSYNTPKRKKRRFVRYYLATNNKKPFCMFHFLVRMSLEDKETMPDESGDLYISLSGSKGTLHDYRMTRHGAIDLYRGSSYQFLVYSGQDLGLITKLDLTWYKPYSFFNPFSWPIVLRAKLHVRGFEVIPLDFLEDRQRISATRVLCSQETVMRERTTTFTPSETCKV